MPSRRDFLQPIVVQSRVIWALLLRETRTRFGKSRLGYAWALLDPLLYIIALSGVFYAMGRHNPPLGTSVILFFATGVLPYRMFSRIAGLLLGAITSNEALFYFPAVKQIDAILARFLLELATYMIVMLLVFAGFAVILNDFPDLDLFSLVGAILALGLLGLGLGIINAVVAVLISSWDRIYSALMTPLFFISGIFFLGDRLPTTAREVAKWNPVLHGIEWFREGFYQGFHSDMLSRSYVIGFGIVLVLIGLAMERALRRRLRAS